MEMTIQNARIECAAKPITHAFIHFKNDGERNKYVRSANMLRKEPRGRKLKINAINGRRGKISSKQNGVRQILQSCETSHPLDSITTNWTLKHMSVEGQIVVKIFQSGNLRYIKYQDFEAEVEGQMQKWQSKHHRNDQAEKKRRR